MFPKRALLHIVDKPNRREIHVRRAVVVDLLDGGHVAGFRGAADGTLERRRVGVVDGAGELGGSEDVGQEEVVVQAPDAVGAGGFKVVCENEFADDGEVSIGR